MLEIYRDGTWSAPRLVPSNDSALALTEGCPAVTDIEKLLGSSPVLHVHIGSLHVAEGHMHLAAAEFARGARANLGPADRADCVGRLAHVLALQGELRRSESVTRSAGADGDRRSDHLRAAQAWVFLQRANFSAARELAATLPGHETADDDLWLAASALALHAWLLISAGEQDAATRLLAGAFEARPVSEWPAWFADTFTVTRAEALLGADELKRCLAMLTPLPEHARASASVVTADALLRIGDLRGARSVLSKVDELLDREPLALRVEALVLGSRLAEERGDREQSRTLLDRALRAAAAEKIRLPLVKNRGWIRRQVDRDPSLSRAHRDFLNTCGRRTVPAPPQPTARVENGSPSAPLTSREMQVLDLLAQMCSTEEIAENLFISINTVKTHVKGIFIKFCVNRRVDAVRRGRELGLC